MSNKRKIDEYQDPDYTDFNCSQKQSKLTCTEKSNKIKSIVSREFSREAYEKELEIYKIENRLQESKRLLQKVRYAVVASYYNKQNLHVANEKKNLFDAEGVHSVCATSSIPDMQQQIHPSLKKLLGKKPVNYDEILSIRPLRQAAKTAKTTIKEKLLTKKEEMKIKRMKGMLNSMNQTTPAATLVDACYKKPRYIEPRLLSKPIPQMNTARGRNQQKHLIAVGNTSKYIGDEKSADGVTHKWLVYIRTKTEVPIEKIINKVRFFLHPSYQPNDVVEVSCPPFTISRRGWGEFPVRVQLYFIPQAQQKPLQILHNLVLDKKLTGLQTMGAETVVEMWLNNIETKKLTSNGANDYKVETETFKTQQTSRHTVHQHTENESQSCIKYQVNFLSGPNEDNPTLNNNINHTLVVKTGESVRSSVTITNNIGTKKQLPVNRTFSSQPPIIHIKQEPDLSIGDEIPFVEAITPTTAPHLKVETTQRLIPIAVTPSQVAATNMVPPKPGKFIKCFDKNGKMSFVEVCYDPQNPKKILLKPNSSVIPIPVAGANNQQRITSTGPSPKLFVKTVGTAQKLFVANNPVKPVPATGSSPVPPQQFKYALQTTTQPSGSQLQQQSLLNTFSKSPVYLNENQLIVKNRQIYVRQPNDAAPPQIGSMNPSFRIKQRPKNQVSLLKKGVSLLKPIVKTNNVNQIPKPTDNRLQLPSEQVTAKATQLASADHDYYSNNSTTTSTVANRNSLDWRLGTHQHQQLEKDTRFLNPKKNCPDKLSNRNYRSELEKLFFNYSFLCVREAVNFLLKRTQLVNKLAARDNHFATSFPFVVKTDEEFSGLILPKQRFYEWSRAKLVSRLLRRHPTLSELQQEHWTTKEILLYARKYAFTPLIAMSTVDESQPAALDADNKNYLKEMIKKEIKREKLKYCSLSLNQAVYDWLSQMYNKCKVQELLSCQDDEINVTDDADNVGAVQNKNNYNSTSNDYYESTKKSTMLIPLRDEEGIAARFVAETCNKIGIKLQTEEIIPDVLHSSTQMVLIQAMKSFIEDVLRRANEKRSACEVESDLVETSVKCDDIKHALLDRKEFDFLTNSHMGKVIPKSIQE